LPADGSPIIHIAILVELDTGSGLKYCAFGGKGRYKGQEGGEEECNLEFHFGCLVLCLVLLLLLCCSELVWFDVLLCLFRTELVQQPAFIPIVRAQNNYNHPRSSHVMKSILSGSPIRDVTVCGDFLTLICILVDPGIPEGF
jgi:hypothetical protein